MIRDDWDLLVDELLDIAEILTVVCITESIRHSTRSSSTRTTDSVNVGLRHIRNIEVDDMRKKVDVDTTSCDIRRYEYTSLSLLKIRKCPLSRIL